MKMKKNNRNNQVVILVLTSIVVIGSIFTMSGRNNAKKQILELNNQVEELKADNSNLKNNLETLSIAPEKKETNNTNDFMNIAQKFVELYPYYDISKVAEKKKELLSISKKEVADSLVPEDMISSSKKILDSKNIKTTGEVYSSDPTLKSKYVSSTMYINPVSENDIEYFSIIQYDTQSSSGDTSNKVYLKFDIVKNDGKILVNNYEVKYLNQ